MSLDADIIRCAAPWPGTAARLLEGFASLGAGTWSLEQICLASGAGTEPGLASQILSGLALTGICKASTDPDFWFSEYIPEELRRLAQILTGADHYRRMRLNPTIVELAVTMPLAPSYLEKELIDTLDRPGGFLTTSLAFSRIAKSASRRLIVMTPYIDTDGFRWLRRIYEATQAECEKILILRNADQYAVELGIQHAAWLRDLNISIRDYCLPHNSNTGRILPIETFHAKILVADDSLAYIGSANLLRSSEGVSLEAGLLVEGNAAMQTARLVEAVLRVARAL